MVYPSRPRCRHRHCKDGEFPHILESKLVDMTDLKHSWAQGGTKLRISSVIPVVARAATAGGIVHIARHSMLSLYAILRSII